jgi:transketolase
MVHGLRFGIDGWGASAPIEAVYDKFGLTVPKITAAVRERLNAQEK